MIVYRHNNSNESTNRSKFTEEVKPLQSVVSCITLATSCQQALPTIIEGDEDEHAVGEIETAASVALIDFHVDT